MRVIFGFLGMILLAVIIFFITPFLFLVFSVSLLVGYRGDCRRVIKFWQDAFEENQKYRKNRRQHEQEEKSPHQNQ